MTAATPIADVPAFSDIGWMSRVGAILYGLAAAAIILLFARESLEPAIWLFEERAGDTVALAIAGWLIATFGPIALSMCVWFVARRLKAQWLFHLISIPAAIILFRQGTLLFFYGAKASGDNSPEGYALFMAAAFLPLMILAHTAAVIVQGYRTITQRANGS